MENYSDYKEKVFDSIKHYQIIIEIYNSYQSNIWFKKEKLNINDMRFQWILLSINNSLLIDIFVTLRCILSTAKDDINLYNLYIEIMKPKICGGEKDKIPEVILKKILPNSYESWIKLKKFINKKIVHKDINTKIKKEDISDIDLSIIFNDLKITFGQITSKKEKATYSFDNYDVKKLSDITFKTMIPE